MFPEISMIKELTEKQKINKQNELVKETIKDINEEILSTANAGSNRIEYFCDVEISITKVSNIIEMLKDAGYSVHKETVKGFYKLYISW